MSKTVTIPSDVTRMEIIINEKTWTFAGGATVTVPDEVAALIATNAANKPKGKRPVYAPLENTGLYQGDDYIPVYTDEDGTMRIRKVDVQAAVASDISSAASAAQAGAEAKLPFVVTFTVNGSTVTASATAAQILAAHKANRVILGDYGGVQLTVAAKTATSSALTAITFQAVINVSENVLTIITFAYASNTWSTSTATYTLTPTT